MKKLPGLRLIGFIALVSIVCLGVYAWADGGDELANHPQFIIKFGWRGNSPDDLDLVNRSPAEIKKKVHNDPTRYKLWHYNNGVAPDPGDGELESCSEATPAAQEPKPEASATGTPKGSKTQTRGLAAFYTAQDAKDFIDFINSAPLSKAKK